MTRRLTLPDEIKRSLTEIDRKLRPDYPNGIPANIKMGELLRVHPGFSFIVYPTDAVSGFPSVDVVHSEGPGFRLVIDPS